MNGSTTVSARSESTTDPRHLEMHLRHRSCFIQASKLFDIAIEPFSIPAPQAVSQANGGEPCEC